MFILSILLFIFVIIFCFYLPGKYFLTKLHLAFPPLELIFLSTIFGLLCFLFICYIFAWLHLDLLVIPLYGVIDLLAVRSRSFLIPPIESRHRLPLVLVSIFSAFFSIPLLLLGIWSNSILYHFDDMLAVALIQELKFRFPPNIPTFIDVPLRNYHFFYDFLLAKITQFFPLSPFSLHFHLIPVFFAFSWGIGVYLLVYKWTNKTRTSLLAVFLTMFGGSFAYLYYLRGHTGISLMDGLGISQPAYSVYNPRITFSIIILLFALITLFHYLKDRRKQLLILFILAAGLMPMIDVYAAIILYSGFLFLTIFELLHRRFLFLFSFIIIGIFFLGTYGVFVGGSGGFLWDPFWAPIGILRAFTWLGYDWRLYSYTKAHNYLKIIALEAYGLFIFLILNLGTRIIGISGLFIQGINHKKFPSLFAVFVCVMLIPSTIIPLFFIQSGKVFEIIQLCFYYLFFSAIFASLGFEYIFTLYPQLPAVFKRSFLILLILLTLPSTYVIYLGVIQGQSNRVSLSSPYFRALNFLRSRGNYAQTILQVPPKEFGPDINGLNSWYNSSSPAVSAFADKQEYFASSGVDFPNTNENARFHDLLTLLQYRDQPDSQHNQQLEKIFKENHIVYIFSPYAIDILLKVKDVHKIYDHTYAIYQVGS